MFAVIYRWTIKPELETQFVEGWAERTKEIAARYGALGSRIHRTDDGAWLAYAQWPSREAWEKAQTPDPSFDTPARKQMAAATETVETLYRLDVVRDLLT